ncbi:hypothetical protein ABT127_36250 [Streptomyces sp. NPDC001904]|uniref:hypothetical protein n=1 Tax=Streptomyces sp. NPDC001904 TaxID=3154531 RepID=UPI00331D670B
MPKNPNTALAPLLREARMSNSDLARAVNQLGTRQNCRFRYDRTAVAHWLGGSRPRQPVPDLVAQILSMSLGRIVTPAETGLLARDTAQRPPHPASADRALHELGAAESDPQQRGALLHLPWSASSCTAGSAPDGPAGTAEVGVGPRPLRGVDQEVLSLYSTQFSTLFEARGSGAARTALRAFVTVDAVSYLTSQASAAQRQSVQLSVARLALLLASATFDAHHLGLAQRYHSAGLALAREADDVNLQAIILRTMSNQARTIGFLADARELAEAAGRLRRQLPSATRAFLLTGSAAIHAAEGDERRSLNCLDEADHFVQAATAGASDPYAAYSRAAFEHQRGEALALLRHHEPAIAAFSASLERRPDEHHRTRAITTCLKAMTQLRMGHLEAACTSLRETLHERAQVDSPRLEHLLHTLHQEVRPYRRHPQVSALLQQHGPHPHAGTSASTAYPVLPPQSSVTRRGGRASARVCPGSGATT